MTSVSAQYTVMALALLCIVGMAASLAALTLFFVFIHRGGTDIM